MDDNPRILMDREAMEMLQTFVKAAVAVMDASEISLQKGLRAAGAARASLLQAVELLDKLSGKPK